ncbi:conserved hypothetical protein [Vibrio nigripulchritudo SOn1]|uniref:Orn/DAP/Arg decarboxylase 2 N-terminal domain-containing protein n=1 Tax=Vibrio nigripulchritudo SOn1 TaxID=1238450 RepID=A0AAV2VK50_9VIBR|nr:MULTISPECIES: hypothetical protein [Vibrio]UAB73915.1 hypothetical protein INR79_22505 [Vibrio sp. SCSIO 43132]CCO44998.1 conserved hypothetical protein [Vibrio nigripulchritudo SOn1]
MYKKHAKECQQIRQLLKEQSPCLVYSERILLDQCKAIVGPISALAKGQVFFPVKASYEPALLRLMANSGISGFEVMSLTELKHVQHLFRDQYPIIYSGLVPCSDVLKRLDTSKDLLVVNSLFDAIAVCQFQPPTKGSRYNILLRISFPSLDSSIKYNGINSKLGVIAYSSEMYRCLDVLTQSDHVSVEGIHCHQLIHQAQSLEYKKMIHMMAKLIRSLKESHQLEVKLCDLGGGLESMESFNTKEVVTQICDEFTTILPSQTLIFEPGRALVNSCGICLSTITGRRSRTHLHHYFVNVGTNLLVPTDSKRYQLIQDWEFGQKNETKLPLKIEEKATLSDGILSPVNTIVDDISLSKPLAISEQVLIGNCGAYTASLEHQWSQPLISVFLLTKENQIINIYQRAEANQHWKTRLETSL